MWFMLARFFLRGYTGAGRQRFLSRARGYITVGLLNRTLGIRLRAFSLGLLAPCMLGLVLILAISALRGGGSGTRTIWGEGGTLSPASPRLVRARPTGSHNPSPRFHLGMLLCRFRFVPFVSSFTAALI